SGPPRWRWRAGRRMSRILSRRRTRLSSLRLPAFCGASFPSPPVPSPGCSAGCGWCSRNDPHAVARLGHGEEFRGVSGGHADAAVGCRIAGNDTLMEPEVAATEALEIRHARIIDGGGPCAVLVRDDELAGGCGAPLPTGGHLRGED